MNRTGKIAASILVLLVLTSWLAPSDNDCLVLLPKISGKYEGACKKGKANGVGKAVGEDTYEGEFKKGMPDGKGKYTWNSGNYFEGNWKEGVKEGEGKLVVKRENLADSVMMGIWKEDEYIGKYENPYEIGSKSPNINKLMVIKKSISPNQVEINIMRKNSKVGITNLRINTNSGTFYDIKNVINQFPLELEIEFDSSSATGFGAAKEKFTCKLKILEEGNWQITIDLANV